MSKGKNQKAALAALEPPGERERAEIVTSTERVSGRRRPAAVAVRKEVRDGIQHNIVGPPHSDDAGYTARLKDAFGTASFDFVDGELSRLAKLATQPDGSIDDTALNGMLAFVESIRPQNELESALAVQMAATHVLAMQGAANTKSAAHLHDAQYQAGLATKAARTFALQLEALAKMRRGGQQTVRVEHVHVYSGGQAVVGAVMAGGGGAIENGNQPYGTRAEDLRAIALTPGSAMWSQDAPGKPLSAHSSEGQDEVPTTRRGSRRRSAKR